MSIRATPSLPPKENLFCARYWCSANPLSRCPNSAIAERTINNVALSGSSIEVLNFWRRTRVGSVEFRGWFRFAQRSINSGIWVGFRLPQSLLRYFYVQSFIILTVFNGQNPCVIQQRWNRLSIKPMSCAHEVEVGPVKTLSLLTWALARLYPKR